MIIGIVRSDEAWIRLKVRRPQGLEGEIDAVVDTGFTAALTLPRHFVTALGLRWRSIDRVTLGDGSECVFDVYVAQVVWDGKSRRVLVDEADSVPLMGMRLLRGYELMMQVRAQGKVTIKRLPRNTNPGTQG